MPFDHTSLGKSLIQLIATATRLRRDSPPGYGFEWSNFDRGLSSAKSNAAEAWSTRRLKRKAHFLDIAAASGGEAADMLSTLQARGQIAARDAEDFRRAMKRANRMLKRWVASTALRIEDGDAR